MQLFLRRNHQDHYVGEGSLIYGCSMASQRIESWLGVLRKQSVQRMDIFKTLRDDGYFTGDQNPEVGVSHIRASHKQVSSLNLQVSSKSQVTVIKIKQVKSSHG